MQFAKRIVLFLLLNFLVVMMISIVLSFFNIKPFLTQHGINYQSLLAFCLIWGMGGALISLAFSRVMAKWMMSVRIIDPNSRDALEHKLYTMVDRLSKKAHLSTTPQVGIYQANELNAFATGPTASKSLVAVSTGLLHRMDDKQIEAVIGHEISHIANGDMVTMTLLQGVVNAFVMFLARILAYAVSTLGRSRDSSDRNISMSYYLFVYLFEVIFMILGSIVVATYSRFREFRADAGGAKLAGKQAMIDSLKTLGSYQQIQDPKENPAMAAFKISHVGKKGLLSLFATHPPIEERIEKLQKLKMM
jgi:heat shock protein HtpX